MNVNDYQKSPLYSTEAIKYEKRLQQQRELIENLTKQIKMQEVLIDSLKEKIKKSSEEFNIKPRYAPEYSTSKAVHDEI